MTQIEFENQLRELRHQKAQVMNQFNLMQNEIKEEIATKNRQIHELSEQVQRLKVKRAGIQEVRLKTEKEWGGANSGLYQQIPGAGRTLMGRC
jgi:chromosome segregation ATPase